MRRKSFKYKNRNDINDKGNVLFLILIAVGLFAALSYAVTQSSRGSTGIDREEAALTAAQIFQYASLVENAINRLRVGNGCRDTDISFENPVSTANYTNPSAPGDSSCHVFEASGGGLQFIEAPDGNDEWLFSGEIVVEEHTINVSGINPELTIILPRISAEVCQAINRAIGIDHPVDNVPVGVNSLAQNPFTGTYLSQDGLGGPTSDPVFANEPSACFREADTDELFFINVLIARGGP